jgi:hypothetical protein
VIKKILAEKHFAFPTLAFLNKTSIYIAQKNKYDNFSKYVRYFEKTIKFVKLLSYYIIPKA